MIDKKQHLKVLVLLDNGHGIDTAGKRSPKLPDGRQLLEYKWCRETVALIAKRLEALGIEYRLVAPEEKDTPLSTRVSRANKYYADAKKEGKLVMFISVHVNAKGMGNWENARGWSTWTSKGVTKGDALAQCLCDEAKVLLPKHNLRFRSDRSDGDDDYEANYYVLVNTNMPATLSENFFMDNREDCEFLLDRKSNELCADIHTGGIVRYIKKCGYWQEGATEASGSTLVMNTLEGIFHKCRLV